jgi:type 1 glutamine amidotransferase
MIAILLLLIINLAESSFSRPQADKILVFYETAGYKHTSIPAGVRAIRKLGEEFKFRVDTSSDSRVFRSADLRSYAAVVFLNTSGDMLDSLEQIEFESYIRSGGGYMGIHGASASEYDWPWYGKLVGAVFDGHPKIQQAVFQVRSENHPAVKHLPSSWRIKEELYNFKNISLDIHVILTVDESSYQGGTNGVYHPMAWYQEFEGGRSFYTALGHAGERYADPLFLTHILEGIRYAMNR